MTVQIAERLILGGEPYQLFTLPLTNYWKLAGLQFQFSRRSTACWRGYVGTWEIIDDRLYMVGIAAELEDGTLVNLAKLFPGAGHRVFAHWYSGTLRIPQGVMLHYVHQGYDSIYERDIVLTVEQGIVAGRKEVDNRRRRKPSMRRSWSVGHFS